MLVADVMAVSSGCLMSETSDLLLQSAWTTVLTTSKLVSLQPTELWHGLHDLYSACM